MWSLTNACNILGVLATSFLAIIALTGLLLPMLRMRQRRQVAMDRPPLEVRQECNADDAEFDIKAIVWRIASEQVGIPINRLRSDDCFYEDFGSFNGIVNLDLEEMLVEAIADWILKHRNIVWVPSNPVRKVTLGDLVTIIESSEFQCATCGYSLDGLQSSRCPECGAQVRLLPIPSLLLRPPELPHC